MCIYITHMLHASIYIDIFRHSARVGFVSYNWSLLIKLMRCYTLCPPKTNMTMEKATIWRCISHWTNVMLTPDADLGGPDMYRWRGCPSTEWSVWHHWIVRWSSGRNDGGEKRVDLQLSIGLLPHIPISSSPLILKILKHPDEFRSNLNFWLMNLRPFSATKSRGSSSFFTSKMQLRTARSLQCAMWCD